MSAEPSQQPEEQVLSGITYKVNQSMVRRARPSSPLISFFKTIVGVSVGLPVFLLVAPLMYVIMLNRRISQRSSAIFIPIVMPMMDKAFSKVKVELLKNLHGRVLDVGCGAGGWLKYFEKATFITELEPNSNHVAKIKQSVEVFREANPNVEVEIVTKFVNELDKSKPYDYIVLGNVMCEVPDQHQFLRDIDAVLKPGGKVVFQEHVRNPDTWKAKFQDMFNLWWCRASDGCNCNRDTATVILQMPNWKMVHWDLSYDAPPHMNRMAVGIIEKQSDLPSSSGDSVSRM